jgi:hypothetical protein
LPQLGEVSTTGHAKKAARSGSVNRSASALNTLRTRSPERRVIIQETANLYGASEQTLYRTLEQRARPGALRRANRGTSTVLQQIRWSITAKLIAAINSFDFRP